MSIQTYLIKKIMKVLMSGWSHGSVEDQRIRQEQTGRYLKLPADVDCQPVDVDGISGEWVAAPGANLGTMLYLHGGSYSVGSIRTHRELAARLSRATGTRALPIDYRLAPEHPYPAALEDACSAYRWLLGQGCEPSRLVIAGDSAGGGLTLATLIALRDAGDPLPAGAVSLSPWTDLTGSGDSHQTRAKDELMLTTAGLAHSAQIYAGGQDLRSPLISPLFADPAGLPPLLIQAGSDEILLDDARQFAEKAQAAGVQVTLQVWEGMFHVFQMIPFLPETKKALGQIGEFVSVILGDRK
jgi:monoterpene epsilon-lactone hydrolase